MDRQALQQQWTASAEPCPEPSAPSVSPPKRSKARVVAQGLAQHPANLQAGSSTDVPAPATAELPTLTEIAGQFAAANDGVWPWPRSAERGPRPRIHWVIVEPGETRGDLMLRPIVDSSYNNSGGWLDEHKLTYADISFM